MGDTAEAWLSGPIPSAALVGAVAGVVMVLRLFRWIRRAVAESF
jgi:hypothetical protein